MQISGCQCVSWRPDYNPSMNECSANSRGQSIIIKQLSVLMWRVVGYMGLYLVGLGF